MERLIKSTNLTQREFARKLNINPNTISNYVNNKFQTINKDHLDAFCKEFNCLPNDVFEFMTDEDYAKYKRNRLMHSPNPIDYFAGVGALNQWIDSSYLTSEVNEEIAYPKYEYDHKYPQEFFDLVETIHDLETQIQYMNDNFKDTISNIYDVIDELRSDKVDKDIFYKLLETKE
ncbi:MAG: helix-turn-helix domain-containing protein [Peptostreptococcaceae bacterium]